MKQITLSYFRRLTLPWRHFFGVGSKKTTMNSRPAQVNDRDIHAGFPWAQDQDALVRRFCRKYYGPYGW